MYILADFAQENKEQKKQPNYLVPALVAGGLGLGALAALRMGSKKSLEAVKKETQQQLEDFKRRFPSVSNKDFEDYAKEMRKKSQGKGATGYLGLTPEEKRVKIANRRALLKEVGNKNEPYGDVRPLPPDPETGVYYLLGKKTAYSSSGFPLSESMRKGINRSISNSNKRNVLRAQDLAESRGLEYRHGSISDFASKIPVYNPNAPYESEGKKYWDWHEKKRDQLGKKYKTTDVETQFEGDDPVFLIKTSKGGHNYVHDKYGKLKEKIKQRQEPTRQPQKKRGWFW